MKKSVLTGMFLVLVGVVAGQTEKAEKVEGYKIQGVIDGKYKADKVYLVEEEEIQGKPHVIDSAIVTDNRYTFTGPKVATPKMYFIKSGDPNSLSPITPFFLENGVIRIRQNADFFLNAEARGTVNNEIFSLYNYLNKCVGDSLGRAFQLERMLYEKKDYETENKEFHRRSNLTKNRDITFCKNMIKTYPDQVFAPFVLYWGLRYRLPLEELKTLRASLPASLNDHPYMKQLDEYIRLAEFKEGSMMPDFTLPDQHGKKISMSDFRGKYVLVDFWASWCGPCMREMPNVAKLYKECKGKNFEILGVSLDSQKENWVTAIKKMNMKWPQVSDLEMWGSAAAKLCNVTAIPYTVLVDPSGKVIALGLRGENLIQKIKEIIDNK